MEIANRAQPGGWKIPSAWSIDRRAVPAILPPPKMWL